MNRPRGIKEEMVLDQRRDREEDFRNCGPKKTYEIESSPCLPTNSLYVKRRKKSKGGGVT